MKRGRGSSHWYAEILEGLAPSRDEDGVFDASPEDDFYWGEVDRSTTREGLRIAQRRGWVEGALFLGARMGALYPYIADGRRGDFSFLIGAGPSTVVWDCSCGFGGITLALARLGSRVIATDPTRERIAFTALRARQEGVDDRVVPVKCSGILGAPIREGSLDAVVLNGVLEYSAEILPHPNPREAQLEVLRFVRSRLKDGGRIYVGIENRWGLEYFRGHPDHGGLKGTNLMPRWLASRVSRAKTGRDYRCWTYSVGGTLKLLRKAGFGNAEPYVTYPSYRHFDRLVPWRNKEAFISGIIERDHRPSRKRRIVGALARHVPGLWLALRSVTQELAYVGTR